jgi:hypothetical protein
MQTGVWASPTKTFKGLEKNSSPISDNERAAISGPHARMKKPAATFAGRAQIQFCDDDLIALICRTSKAIFR